MGISRGINLTIFLITLILTVGFFRKDGEWKFERFRKALRYFTFLSNAFCALGSLCMFIAPEYTACWILKYISTVAVTVTMLTVFLFLAPTFKTLTGLLKGSELFMHLLTPLMAIISLCVFERHPLSFPLAITGVIPVLLYGAWYLYQIMYAPKEKRWEDFYGFNRGGKWPVAFAAMMIATFLICMGYMAIMRMPA